MTRKETLTKINPVDQRVLNLFKNQKEITDQQIKTELKNVGNVDVENCDTQVQAVVRRLRLKAVRRGFYTFYTK